MSEELSVYEKMDLLDDQQIVAEINNNISVGCADLMFYSFPQNGRKIENLSKRGIDECRLRYARGTGHRIIEGKPEIEIDPFDDNFVFVNVQVQEWRGKELLNTFNGCKRQNRTEQFYYEKGVNKAIRNALMRMIPIGIQQEVLQTSKQIQAQKQNPNYNNLPKNNRPALPAPQRSIEDLVKDQGWMSEKYPYPITLVIGEEITKVNNITWSDLERYDGVQKKDGGIVGLRQYLHMCSVDKNHGNKFKASAIVFKENEQNAQNDTQQQEELFDNTPDTEESTNHYESEVGA